MSHKQGGWTVESFGSEPEAMSEHPHPEQQNGEAADDFPDAPPLKEKSSPPSHHPGAGDEGENEVGGAQEEDADQEENNNPNNNGWVAGAPAYTSHDQLERGGTSSDNPDPVVMVILAVAVSAVLQCILIAVCWFMGWSDNSLDTDWRVGGTTFTFTLILSVLIFGPALFVSAAMEEIVRRRVITIAIGLLMVAVSVGPTFGLIGIRMQVARKIYNEATGVTASSSSSSVSNSSYPGRAVGVGLDAFNISSQPFLSCEDRKSLSELPGAVVLPTPLGSWEYDMRNLTALYNVTLADVRDSDREPNAAPAPIVWVYSDVQFVSLLYNLPSSSAGVLNQTYPARACDIRYEFDDSLIRTDNSARVQLQVAVTVSSDDPQALKDTIIAVRANSSSALRYRSFGAYDVDPQMYWGIYPKALSKRRAGQGWAEESNIHWDADRTMLIDLEHPNDNNAETLQAQIDLQKRRFAICVGLGVAIFVLWHVLLIHHSIGMWAAVAIFFLFSPVLLILFGGACIDGGTTSSTGKYTAWCMCDTAAGGTMVGIGGLILTIYGILGYMAEAADSCSGSSSGGDCCRRSHVAPRAEPGIGSNQVE